MAVVTVGKHQLAGELYPTQAFIVSSWIIPQRSSSTNLISDTARDCMGLAPRRVEQLSLFVEQKPGRIR